MQTRKCHVIAITAAAMFLFYLFVWNKPPATHTQTFTPGTRLYFSTRNLNLSVVLETARSMNMKNGIVMIALINNAYVPMTLNWLCNTKHMNIHELLLLIATDDKSRTIIENHWPNVRVFSLGTDAFSGGQTFGQAGYTRVLAIRSAIISSLLNEGIETFLFETDSVWLTNPVPAIRNISGVDFIVNHRYEITEEYALGLLYMHPTEAARFVFANLTATYFEIERKLKSLPPGTEVSWDILDQPMMSSLINNYPGVRLHVLPYHDYIDGVWYDKPEIRKESPKPFVIHNNFIRTVASKESRLQSWGHWFLKNDFTCAFDKVQKLVCT